MRRHATVALSVRAASALAARSARGLIVRSPRGLAVLAALVLAVARAEPPAPNLTQRQTTLLSINCVQCHALPGVGAPLIGDQAAWKSVREGGEDAALRNVLNGIRGMPPLGYCGACSEEDFRALIRFMAGPPEKPSDPGAPK